MSALRAVCVECLELSTDGTFPAGGGLVAHLGSPRGPVAEPEDGCFLCTSGAQRFVLVPVELSAVTR